MFTGRLVCILSVGVIVLFAGQALGSDPPPYGFKPEYYTGGSGNTKDRVKLTDVQVLTLYKDKWTNGRRSQAVPQLKCVGGSAGCSNYVPQTVQCYNRGFDGNDVQWECKAEMDRGYKFGEIEVSCEGYDYPDDPYILQGSCGLQYKLEHTSDYSAGGGSYEYGGQSHQPYRKQKDSFLSNLIFYIIMGLAIYTVYRVFVNLSGPNRPGPEGTGGPSGYGGGGGGGGPGDGGPPPPGFRPDYYSGSGDSCGGYGQSHGSNRYYGPGSNQQANRPGFWTGLGAGGLLGYMMGNRGGQRGYYNQPTGFFGGGGPSVFGGGGGRSSGMFGGGGGGGSGGGTQTSSGFGGTRRR